MTFASFTQPSPTRPRSESAQFSGLRVFYQILVPSISPPTFLFTGACLQSVLLPLLPAFYALAPAILYLSLITIDNVTMAADLRPNRYMHFPASFGRLGSQTTFHLPHNSTTFIRRMCMRSVQFSMSSISGSGLVARVPLAPFP